MSAPAIASDGFRYYAQWAGNERGVREDRTCCIEEVWPSGSGVWHPRQCNRKRSHGPDKLYCKQHAKLVAARGKS